jgi:hypothetical protein
MAMKSQLIRPLAHKGVLATVVAATALAVLSGCAVAPPTGPSVVALPSQGEPLATFQHDDYTCRNYAYGQTNPNEASQQATNSAVSSAAIGTVGGAAVGALLGAAAGNAGAGAAIGAGTGLVFGGAAGAGSAQNSADALQARYDAAYAQCMTSKGNAIQPQAAPAYYAPPPGYYAPPPAVYYGPPRRAYWW